MQTSATITPGNTPCRASVIIPCYKRPELVRAAIQSVLRQDLDPSHYEILVADSSPMDCVERVVEELQPSARCRLLYFHKNAEGPGPSRNLGAQHARGQYFVFLDSDCEATPGWLSAIIDAFGPGVGIVQGRTLPAPTGRQGVFSHTIRVESESCWYETANIAYSRDCFHDAGGFWNDWTPEAITPLGGEDVDLAWRAKRKGWKTRFCEDALVYHEIIPMRLISWVWIRRLQVFPWLIRKYPELRQFFFARYFYDRAQAALSLGLLGTCFLPFSNFALLAWLPYVISRSIEPTRTLRGPLRLLRPLFYFLRDACSFGLLAAGSFRARTLLL